MAGLVSPGRLGCSSAEDRGCRHLPSPDRAYRCPCLPVPCPQHLHQQEAQGADFLVNLPEHCVKETAGERLVVGSGLASILLQLAAAYVALSLTLRLPVKGE